MGTINTNDLGALSGEVSVIDSSAIGIFIDESSGSHNNHVITLQASPDGTLWQDTDTTITGLGYRHVPICANKVRLKVSADEGSESICTIALDKC